jgi:hypothetical protein
VRPPRAPRASLTLTLEPLEERALLNAAWGVSGPPVALNAERVPAGTIALHSGAAQGDGAIKRHEVDYRRFTPQATGFYRVSATARFDTVIGVYGSGPAAPLLGYADDRPHGAEKATVYLEAGQTYYVGITNFRTGPGGRYSWKIDDVGSSTAAPDGRRTLYLNFDGATLTAADLRLWDNDWKYGKAKELDPQGDGVVVQPLLADRTDRDQIISGIMTRVQADLEPFGVRVVRLKAGAAAVAGVGATTVFLGPSTLEDHGINSAKRNLFHTAGDIDVGNNNLTDIAFVTDETWGSADATATALADVVLHEAGHTYGLFHVQSRRWNETMGLRYSIKNQVEWVQDTGYLDRSFRYDGYKGSQNSYQVVAAAFGVGGELPAAPADAWSAAPAHRAKRLTWRAWATRGLIV